ncbi:MAG: FAD-dependent oxidoreductase [Nanoarchaeota archaeon]|jgi:thioredoxin reductase (NADPH)|nr:FAD-dependent oxidoreductase [Nanoarchaeota archaeon]
METHDLVIIGAGPGGYSAAIYAARYQMDVLLIGEIPGGIAGTAHDIRNYPGFAKVSGMELMMKIIEQAKLLEVPVKQTIVQNISKGDGGFFIKTGKEEFFAKKILIATGTARRELGVPREKELTGRGVSYCATCDAGFYKDKIVGVIGGGDAALTAALLLAKFASKVYIFYRKKEFTKAEVAWVTEVEKNEKIEVMFEEEVSELIGEEKLTGVKMKSEKEISMDGLFIEIGGTPNTKLAEELGLELSGGSIVVDKEQNTNVYGIFAAGDVTDRPFKQIATASGDGATACYTAFKELRSEKATL